MFERLVGSMILYWRTWWKRQCDSSMPTHRAEFLTVFQKTWTKVTYRPTQECSAILRLVPLHIYKFLVPLTSLQLIINIFIHNSRCLFTPTSRHVLPNRQPSPVITYIGHCCLTLDCHSNSACSHILLLLQNRVVCLGASIQAFGKHSAVATSWSCKHFSSGPNNDRSIQAASKQYSKVCNKTSFFKYNFWLFR